MTKRSETRQTKAGGITGILIAAAVVVLLVISEITGVDVLGVNPTATPTPTATMTATATALPTVEVTLPATGTEVASLPGAVTVISVPQGFGAAKGFWEVYFTAPSGSGDRSTYTAGIDTRLAQAVASAQRTIDLAAFELNLPILTQALLEAHERGVQIRVVTDDEHGIEDEDSTIGQLVEAGVPVVADNRGAFMHNKFMIIDGTVVWTGSWNFTINDTYRNNNNALALRSQAAVRSFQAEFDEMFGARQFGPRSPQNNPNHAFTQDGVPVEIYFAPEEDVVPAIAVVLNGAQESIRFMAFSFTLDSLADVLLRKAADGIVVTGIFDSTSASSPASEMARLRCAGLDVRRDGNPFILHHKVFIVDDDTVITGSFNFSASAADSNDENLIIVRDPDLAAQYLAEFDRRWAEAVVSSSVTCS